jgi:hypothetical protein
VADSLADVFSGFFQVKSRFERRDTQELGYAANAKNDTRYYEFGDGDGEDAAEHVYADTRTIQPNSVDTIDLLSFSQDALEISVPFTFANIEFLRVINNATGDDHFLYFGASEANPSQSFAIAIGPESEALLVNRRAGYGVTNGNNVLRTYNPNGVAIEYEIYIIGSPT